MEGIVKEEKRKGGRPKSAQPRVFYITCSFTQHQIDCIIDGAKTLGISKSEYVAQMALEGKILDTYSPAQRALVLRLVNISNNLNQLAKLAHTAGIMPMVMEIDSLLVQIRKLIRAGQ